MTTALKLEIASLGKSSKKNAAGIELITYNCKLVGSIGSVQATLTLKSGEIKELQDVVPQAMDNIVMVEIRDVSQVVGT